MAVFIPDLFSSYVKGRRAAIQDNWNDLTKYNKVLGGQLQNAFNMETFDDAARIAHNKAAVSDMQRVGQAVDTSLGLQTYQAAQDAGLVQATIDAKIAQLQQLKAQAVQQYDSQIAELERKKAEEADKAKASIEQPSTTQSDASETVALETTGVSATPGGTNVKMK